MMPSLTAFFYPCFMGYLLLSAMLHRIALRHKPLLYVATAFPVGAGLCSLILYFSYLIFAPNAKLISTTFSVIATVCLLVYRITRPAPRLSFAEPAIPKMSWRDKGALRDLILPILSFLLFAVTFATVLYYYSLAAPLEIHGGGDVRYFWSLKAKFFFRAPEAWKNMFSPKIFWSHIDYPLLLPAIRAWGWNWLGHESLLWPLLVAAGFYVSFVFILIWYLSSYVSWTTAWIGGTFFLVLNPFLRWTIWQYADPPLAFFITASALTLVTALRSGENRLLLLSGLLGGLAAWTKNEGLFFIFWIYLILGGISWAAHHSKKEKPFTFLFLFTLGALLPLIAVGILKGFLGVQNEFLESGKTLYAHRGILLWGWDKTLAILRAFHALMTSYAEWKGLWVFFAAASVIALLSPGKTRRDFLWVFFLLVFLIQSGYFFIYQITPHDLLWHLKFSLDRLIMHAGGLAIVFIFEILTFKAQKSE